EARSLDQGDHFCRNTIRPRVRSYGESSTFTRSPGRMRMKCLRIFQETIPRISRSELSSLSLNMAFGNAVLTVASTSMGSDLAKYCSGKETVDQRNINRGRGTLQVGSIFMRLRCRDQLVADGDCQISITRPDDNSPTFTEFGGEG